MTGALIRGPKGSNLPKFSLEVQGGHKRFNKIYSEEYHHSTAFLSIHPTAFFAPVHSLPFHRFQTPTTRQGTALVTGVKRKAAPPRRPPPKSRRLHTHLRATPATAAILDSAAGAMIQLLFTVLAAEAGVAAALLFKTPLRKLAMLALDGLKRGRGPVMVRTVAATVLVVLASSVHSMAKIRGRAAGELDGAAGGLTPTDQVLLARHLLEASLMGYALFLALVIDRLHNYIREIRGLKKNLEAVSKQSKTILEENKSLHNQLQSANITQSPTDTKKDT